MHANLSRYGVRPYQGTDGEERSNVKAVVFDMDGIVRYGTAETRKRSLSVGKEVGMPDIENIWCGVPGRHQRQVLRNFARRYSHMMTSGGILGEKP